MEDLTPEQLAAALAKIERVENYRDENLSVYTKDERILPEVEVAVIKDQPRDSRLRRVTVGSKTINASIARGVDPEIQAGSLYIVKAKRSTKDWTNAKGETVRGVEAGTLNYRIYAAEA